MIERFLLMMTLVGSAISAQAVAAKEATAGIDPTKSYVVVELGQLDGATPPGTISLARYDEARHDLEHLQSDHKGARAAVFRAGKSTQIVKDKRRRIVMIAAAPGLWTVEGVNDTAFSLTSSTFRLEAGTVTDLGVATIYTDFPEGDRHHVPASGSLTRSALFSALIGGGKPQPIPKAVEFRPRTSADLQLPASIAVRARPVVWTGEVRFGNYMGGLVNRMGGRKARLRAMVADQARSAGDDSPESSAAGAASRQVVPN